MGEWLIRCGGRAAACALAVFLLLLAAACSSGGDDDDAATMDDDEADDDASPGGDDDNDDNNDDDNDSTPADPLFGPDADWNAQDTGDSQGVQRAAWDVDRLNLSAHLVGGDAQLAHGEIRLDLRYVFGLDCAWPVDLSAATIAFALEIPSGFVKSRGAASAQAFVKDANWRRQMGAPTAIDAEGVYQVELAPSASGVSGGQTDDGFDPTKIRFVGLRINYADSGAFEGELHVNAFQIDPAVDIPAGPDLPATTPPPEFAEGDQWSVGSGGFLLNGESWFVVGGNWRMIEYGQNFGANAWFPTGDGVYKHQGFLRVYLDYLRRAGVKVVRVGLGEDGRNLFDEDGHVTGRADVP
jgi:hypothetical protein